MQSYGSDRLRHKGEQWIVSSRLDKGWTARAEKTLTTAEFPGTAVLWEDSYFEVVRAEPLPNGVRYVLEAWREHHAIRVSDRYDAESEAHRIEEQRSKVQREKYRKTANALALLTGHLPALVQQHLASELGLLPPRMTAISIIGSYAVVAAIVLWTVARIMAQQLPSLPAIIVAAYLTAENTARWLICWTQSRPIGSVPGWIAYALYYAFVRRGPSPFAVEKGMSVKISDAPPDIAARDALTVREALVTLLTPADQAKVATRYGYDYRRESRAVAVIILAGALIGMVSSYRSGAVIALVIAAALAFEQVVRLAALRRGPAASVLRFLVRPLVRRLL